MHALLQEKARVLIDIYTWNCRAKHKNQLNFKSFVSRYNWKNKIPADCCSTTMGEKERTKQNIPDRFLYYLLQLSHNWPWAYFIWFWFMPTFWKCNLNFRWQYKLELAQAESNRSINLNWYRQKATKNPNR